MNKQIQALRPIQASSTVLFHKLHTLHWNVKGQGFYELHEKTEDFYDKMGTLFDDLAERILMLGETPLYTLDEFKEHSDIKELGSEGLSSSETAKIIVEDFNILQKLILNALELSEEDTTTTAILEENKAWLEKQKWMLTSYFG